MEGRWKLNDKWEETEDDRWSHVENLTLEWINLISSDFYLIIFVIIVKQEEVVLEKNGLELGDFFLQFIRTSCLHFFTKMDFHTIQQFPCFYILINKKIRLKK
jgi:hypothetical protein